MHIVLVHPDIPGNTGNIGRSCVALSATLHLVRPMGFILDEKKIRRAGLDYWEHLDLNIYDSLSDFEESFLKDKKCFLFSRFATRPHWEPDYWAESIKREPILIFGSETKGLPQDFKDKHQDSLIQIPVPGQVRSLNLATSAGIAMYEVYRQKNIK